MDENFIYGTASVDDLPALKELRTRSFGIHEKHFTEKGWQEFSEGLNNEDTIQRLFDKSVAFTCRHNAKIVGAAYFISSGHPEGMFEKE